MVLDIHVILKIWRKNSLQEIFLHKKDKFHKLMQETFLTVN